MPEESESGAWLPKHFAAQSTMQVHNSTIDLQSSVLIRKLLIDSLHNQADYQNVAALTRVFIGVPVQNLITTAACRLHLSI